MDNVAGVESLGDGSLDLYSQRLYEAADTNKVEVPDSRWPLLQMNDRIHRKIPEKLAKLDQEKVVVPSHTLLAGLNPEKIEKDIIPVVHDLENYLSSQGNPIEKYNIRKSINYLEKCDKVIAISESTKQDLLQETSLDSKQIYVVIQGISPERFYTDNQQPSIAIPDKYILYVGAMLDRKNPDFLVDLLEELPDDYQLVHAGKIYDESNKEDFIEYAEKNGVRNQIEFLGYISQSDLRRIYTNAESYIHPAKYEGYGRTPVEAAACGTVPVLHSEIPSAECLENTAAVFEEFNAEKVARLVLDEAGRNIDYEPRTWKDTAEIIEEVLRK
jgi:glycosyltransferase involved in cell wall biosynthesis